MIFGSNSMNVQFYNLTEDQISKLRNLEDQNQAECMLKITKKSFIGVEHVSLIIETAGLLFSLLELIHEWKGSGKAEIVAPDNGIGANQLKISITTQNGLEFRAEFKNISDTALKEVTHAFTEVFKHE